jgi:hypothetical protein
MDQFHRNHDPEAIRVAHQHTCQAGEGSGFDPDTLADRQIAVGLNFVRVQAGTQSLNLELRELCRLASCTDERNDPGKLQHPHPVSSVDSYEQIAGEQGKIKLRFAAVLPAMYGSIQRKKMLQVTLGEMGCHALLMSGADIRRVPLRKVPWTREHR